MSKKCERKDCVFYAGYKDTNYPCSHCPVEVQDGRVIQYTNFKHGAPVIVKNEMEPKDTNPKDAIGIKKVSTFVIPSYPQFLEGIVFMSGARKYGAFNWRESGVRFSVYYDALKRHLDDFKEGEDIDTESGVSHLAHARACLAIILDSMKMGNWIDDRPPKYPDGLGIKDLNDKAAKVIERYPNCVEPFTELLAAEKIAKLYGSDKDENKS